LNKVRVSYIVYHAANLLTQHTGDKAMTKTQITPDMSDSDRLLAQLMNRSMQPYEMRQPSPDRPRKIDRKCSYSCALPPADVMYIRNTSKALGMSANNLVSLALNCLRAQLLTTVQSDKVQTISNDFKQLNDD